MANARRAVRAYLGLWLAASVAFTLGIWTPISGTLLTGGLAYQLAFDLNLYSNHVYLMLIATGLLTVAGSGSALSLDAFLRRHRGDLRTVSYACVFLLQFQVSVVYFFTGVQKVNDRFVSGAVLQNVLAGGEAIPGPVLQVASVGVILSELFLAIALWVPSWRRWAFVAGFGLHAAIPILMPGNRNDLIVFSVLMLGMYLAFLPRVPSKLVVVWDAECSFCSNWIRLVRTLDWLARVELVRAADRSALARLRATPESVGEELKVLSGSRTLGGYDALVEVAHVLPLTLFWAPLLGLPLVARVGRRLYRSVAVRRGCRTRIQSFRLPVAAGR